MSGDARRQLKAAAARAAIEHVRPGEVIGVGTGSTADEFIDLLACMPRPVAAAVASSEASAARLGRHGIRVVGLGEVDSLPLALYVDGADEATRGRQLIKGGGGALTREKIVASACRRFVCIVDDRKLVRRLGAFPVAVEVIELALRPVALELERMGGRPVLRDGFVTDNGHRILDVTGLDLEQPARVEGELNQIPGVVASGLFCRRPADLLIVAGTGGVTAY